jgi:hypothetical protein
VAYPSTTLIRRPSLSGRPCLEGGRSTRARAPAASPVLLRRLGAREPGMALPSGSASVRARARACARRRLRPSCRASEQAWGSGRPRSRRPVATAARPCPWRRAAPHSAAAAGRASSGPPPPRAPSGPGQGPSPAAACCCAPCPPPEPAPGRVALLLRRCQELAHRVVPKQSRSRICRAQAAGDLTPAPSADDGRSGRRGCWWRKKGVGSLCEVDAAVVRAQRGAAGGPSRSCYFGVGALAAT